MDIDVGVFVKRLREILILFARQARGNPRLRLFFIVIIQNNSFKFCYSASSGSIARSICDAQQFLFVKQKPSAH